MDKIQQLVKIEDYVYNLFHDDTTGHNYYHMKRVAKMAKFISLEEHGDSFISEAAGWLHDVGDKKLFDKPEKALKEMDAFLKDIQIDDKEIVGIKIAMSDVSFSEGDKTPITLEGKIVQDADRLDALGAIGIARTFAYGGAHNQLIYHLEKHNGTSIQHFYEKLLLLSEKMNTNTGRNLARRRHNFMIEFLDKFDEEWEEWIE